MGNFLMEMEANVRTLILIFIGLVYLFLGAAIFSAVERNNEEERKISLTAEIEHIKMLFKMTDLDFKNLTRIALEMQPHKAGTQWSFVGALYFSITVVTTIGYGHSVPQTVTGKIFCMIYATMGIPICLVMFQAMGERINNAAKYCLKKAGRKLGFKFDEISHRCLVPFGIFSCVLTVIVGTISFAAFEGWSYVESVYYCVMTLSTIGFGDYVALQDDGDMQDRPHYVAFSLIYIMIGLTVIGAFLNLVILRMMVTLPDTPEGSTNGDHEALDRRSYAPRSLEDEDEDDYGSGDEESSELVSDYGAREDGRGLRKSVRDYLYNDSEQGRMRRPLKLTALCRMNKRRNFERRWRRKATSREDGDSSSDETSNEQPRGVAATRNITRSQIRQFRHKSAGRTSRRKDHDRLKKEWSCACRCLRAPMPHYPAEMEADQEHDDTFYKPSAVKESYKCRDETQGKEVKRNYCLLGIDTYSDSGGVGEGFRRFVPMERHGRQVSNDSGYSGHAHGCSTSTFPRSPNPVRREAEHDAVGDLEANQRIQHSPQQHMLNRNTNSISRCGPRSPSPLLSDSADPVVVYNKKGAGKTITIHQGRRRDGNDIQAKAKIELVTPEKAYEHEKPIKEKRLQVLMSERSATPPLLRQNGFSDNAAPSIVVTTCSPKLARACDSLSHQDSNETTVTVLTSEVEDSVFLEQRQCSLDEKSKPEVTTELLTNLSPELRPSDPAGSAPVDFTRNMQLWKMKSTDTDDAEDNVNYSHVQCRCECHASEERSRASSCESDGNRSAHNYDTQRHAERRKKHASRRKRKLLRKTKSVDVCRKENDSKWRDQNKGPKKSRWSVPFIQLFSSTPWRRNKDTSPHVTFSAVAENSQEQANNRPDTPSQKCLPSASKHCETRGLHSAVSGSRYTEQHFDSQCEPAVVLQTKMCSLATLEDEFDSESFSSVTSLSSYLGMGSTGFGTLGYDHEVC